ncbi:MULTISPECIES: hypothetical protein [Leptolyngbya]|nr:MULTISPECIES: hypothetical protein [Leptolyngbya]
MNITCDASPLFWGWLAGERQSKRYDRSLGIKRQLRVSREI